MMVPKYMFMCVRPRVRARVYLPIRLSICVCQSLCPSVHVRVCVSPPVYTRVYPADPCSAAGAAGAAGAGVTAGMSSRNSHTITSAIWVWIQLASLGFLRLSSPRRNPQATANKKIRGSKDKNKKETYLPTDIVTMRW